MAKGKPTLKYGDTVTTGEIDGFAEMAPPQRSKILQWLDQYHMPENAQLTADEALTMITDVRAGRISVDEAAQSYGVSPSAVRDAVTGRTWARRLVDGGYLDDKNYAMPLRRKVSPAEEKEIVDLIKRSPLSIQEIAADYGLSHVTVYNISRAHQHDPRKEFLDRARPKYVRKKGIKLTFEEKREIFDLFHFGPYRLADLAELYGVSPSYISVIGRTNHKKDLRCVKPVDSNRTNRKLRTQDAQEIYEAWVRGATQRELAAAYDVAIGTVYGITTGRTYKHLRRYAYVGADIRKIKGTT